MTTTLVAGQPRGGDLPLGEVLQFMRLLWAIEHALEVDSKRLEARLGVTGPQRLVIRIVGRFPGISAGRLAEVLRLDPSTLTPMIRRLSRRGMLDRRTDPRDRRRILLGLTAKGRKLDEPAASTIESIVAGALAGLPRGSIEAAASVLATLARALDPPRA